MVPRCSATWRAEYKRVRASNRGLASHAAVSPISDSNEFMAGFPATSESNDLMTGSCHSCTAVFLTTSIPRFYMMRVPAGRIHVPASPLPRLHAVFVVEVDIRQIGVPRRLEGAATRICPHQ